jgi:K+-transporting ATPase ATPase A chain
MQEIMGLKIQEQNEESRVLQVSRRVRCVQFSSANNGQTMAGLSANNIFYNTTTIVAMLVGRDGLAILALALAGRFAAVSRRPTGAGTMPSDSVLFGFMLAGTALLVGALNFLPALALGPILEYFSIQR